MLPYGIYSSNNLLAYLAISSGRFHLFSPSLKIFSNHLEESGSDLIFSSSESVECHSLLVDEEDGVSHLFLFLDSFFLSFLFGTGSPEFT